MTGPQQGYSPDNPFAKKYSADNPFAGGYSADNPFANGGSSATSQLEPDQRPGLVERYKGAVGQIVQHPIDALTGMAKAVLFDALKATVTPVQIGGRTLGAVPPGIAKYLPEEITRPESFGQYAKNVGLTAANFALPATRSIAGAAAVGAGLGAVTNPDDPALGAALGATVGPAIHLFGQGAAAVGRRAGLLKAAASGAPIPETKAPTPEAPPPPATSAIRDLSNADILDMTPEGIKILSKQASKEERALYSELFGPKGARRYRSAAKTSTSADASPEAAARALAEMQRMYSELTDTQQKALDEIQARGFTGKRLSRIADLTKDYTPENLAKVDDESLVRQFGEVLMSHKPDRNLAGLYRLRSVYGELLGRGVDETKVLRGVYEYMLGQGVKPEGLGPLILGKMDDVRKTLSRVVPDKVSPDVTATPPAAVAPASEAVPPAAAETGLRGELGTVSEPELQQELSAITPRPQAPIDEEAAARARVEAARTTPFPGTQPEIQNPISAPRTPLMDRIETFIKSETGSMPDINLKDAAQAARDAGYMDNEINRGWYDKTKPLAGYKFYNGDLVQATPELVQQIKASSNATIDDLKAKLFQTEAIIKRNGEAAYNKVRDQIWGSDSRTTTLEKAEAFVRSKIADLKNHTAEWDRQLARARGGSPEAVDAVRNFVKDESGVLNLDSFRDPLQTKVDMSKLNPAEQRVQKQIRTGYEPDQSNPLKPLEGLYTALVRRTYPLEKGEAAVRKATGKPVPVRERPSAAIQLLAGWAGKAEHFLKYGGFRNINGQIVENGTPGLEGIFKKAGDLNAWRRLIISERVNELDAAGRKVETGIDPVDARQVIANASPQARAAVADSHQYLDNVLQYATDSQLLDPMTTQYLRLLGKAYVPLDRVFSKGAKIANNVKYAALSTPQAFRQLVGNKLQIIDPAYSMVDYTRRVIRASELNKVGLSIKEFVDAHPNETKGWLTRDKNVTASSAPNIVANATGLQQIAKKLGINLDLNTSKQIAGMLSDNNLLIDGDIMRVRVNGELQQYRVDPVIGKILRSIGPQEIPLWLRLAALPSQSLKVGVTANPVFGAFQAFVGAFQSKVQSKYGFRVTQDPLSGLVKRLSGSKDYREALAAGGTSAYLSATGRSTTSALRNIAPGGKAIRTITHPLEALRAVADPLEEMNRLGEYARARKSGADPFEAALAMREVDTDFSQIGTQMAGLAHLVAFANPFIQAGDKAVRTLAKNPQAWLQGITAVTAPTVAFWLAAEGDKEVRDLQRSDQGQRNWFLRLPKSGEIVKIPKPYLYGEIFGNTAEAVMNQMETHDPQQWGTFAKGLRDNFSFLMLPTSVQTAIGGLSGKNPLGWQDIVPQSRAGLESSLQYTNQTTQAARVIGDKLNISPAKIDFAIQSLGGTLAQEGIRSLDHVLPQNGASPPAPVSADLPLVGRFFARYPSESVEPIRTFYKNAGDAQVKLNTARKYIDQMQPEKAKEYIEKHQDVLALASAYGDARQKFTEQRNMLEKIRDVPDDVMTPQTKRELTDQILEGMIEAARAMNEGVRSARRANTQQGAVR